MKQKSKIEISREDFREALKAYAKEKSKLTFLAITKAFEVLLEYSWKNLKTKVEDEGIEVYSPKETIREAARLEFINNPELWIKAINARNESVHDYYSMTEEDFIKLIKRFEKEI